MPAVTSTSLSASSLFVKRQNSVATPRQTSSTSLARTLTTTTTSTTTIATMTMATSIPNPTNTIVALGRTAPSDSMTSTPVIIIIVVSIVLVLLLLAFLLQFLIKKKNESDRKQKKGKSFASRNSIASYAQKGGHSADIFTKSLDGANLHNQFQDDFQDTESSLDSSSSVKSLSKESRTSTMYQAPVITLEQAHKNGRLSHSSLESDQEYYQKFQQQQVLQQQYQMDMTSQMTPQQLQQQLLHNQHMQRQYDLLEEEYQRNSTPRTPQQKAQAQKMKAERSSLMISSDANPYRVSGTDQILLQNETSLPSPPQTVYMPAPVAFNGMSQKEARMSMQLAQQQQMQQLQNQQKRMSKGISKRRASESGIQVGAPQPSKQATHYPNGLPKRRTSEPSIQFPSRKSSVIGMPSIFAPAQNVVAPQNVMEKKREIVYKVDIGKTLFTVPEPVEEEYLTL